MLLEAVILLILEFSGLGWQCQAADGAGGCVIGDEKQVVWGNGERQALYGEHEHGVGDVVHQVLLGKHELCGVMGDADNGPGGEEDT